MALEFGLEDKPWYVAVIIGVVLAVLIYFGSNMWLLKPLRQEIDRLDSRLSDLQAKIQEGRTARQQLPRFREEVQALELELERLLRILPARRNTPELLRRIRELTMQGDFELLSFTPSGFIDKGFYSEWPISINLDGTYHNLAMFFDRIGRFPRIINIEGLRVEAVRRRAGLHTITASFKAKTFVYKDLEEDEAASP